MGTPGVLCSLPAVSRFVEAPCGNDPGMLSLLVAGATYVKVLLMTVPGGASHRTATRLVRHLCDAGAGAVTAVRGFITFADTFDTTAALTANLTPVGGAPVGASGTAQVVISRDGGTALIFAGVSGLTPSSSSVNGPLPYQSAPDVAPVLLSLPAAPFAFFVAPIASSFGASALSGLAYVKVTSPTGSVRGTLASAGSSTVSMTVFLSGAQQWPAPVQSLAFGVASVVVDTLGMTIIVSLDLRGLASQTMVHVHVGTLFEAGPAVLPLPMGSFGPTVLNMSVALLEAIMVGRAYINVHTTQHAPGACLPRGSDCLVR